MTAARHGLIAAVILSSIANGSRGDSPTVEHVEVYRVPGRFGGWPANHGIWSWENEILVGFGAGYHKDNGPERHNIDHDKPEEHLLARSLDGGASWTIEDPAKKGALIPVGKSLHGVTPPGLTPETPTDCPGGINFAHPDFALTIRMNDVNVGPSRFYYSLDRGHQWSGPFNLPRFGTPGIAARTDYVVDDKDTCTLFLTAGKRNGKEGRPLCARTTDGGRTWRFLSWIGPEPLGFAIMPSSVRLSPTSLFTTLRVHGLSSRTIDAWRSNDDGKNWEYVGQPVADTGTGNPPSLLRLADRRLCLTYGFRKAPFGIHATLSEDEGKTWSKPIVLREDGGGRDIGYPRSVQRPDGKVVVVYYFHDTPTSERYVAATLWDPNTGNSTRN